MIASPPIWSEYKIRTYPSLGSTTLEADVAIIGGGFTGLSAAYHLLKMDPKKTVIVLEADKLGAGASGHTTGMLGPGVGRNLSGLVNRYGAQTAKALYEATIDAVNNVRSLITNEAIDCELQMTGQILVARSAAGRRRLKTQADGDEPPGTSIPTARRQGTGPRDSNASSSGETGRWACGLTSAECGNPSSDSSAGRLSGLRDANRRTDF